MLLKVGDFVKLSSNSTRFQALIFLLEKIDSHNVMGTIASYQYNESIFMPLRDLVLVSKQYMQNYASAEEILRWKNINSK